MLTSIIRFSLRFRGVVIALAALLVAYGAYLIPNLRLSVFPEFSPALVLMQTEAPGLSAKQVESLVTQPIENVMNGLTGLATLRSKSMPGLSVVRMTFAPGTDLYRDRQLVSERATQAAAQMPAGVLAPTMLPLSSSTGIVLVVGLTSRTANALALRSTADWVVKPKLLSVRGVAGVNIFGGGVKELQLALRPSRLAHYGITESEVLRAARLATGVRSAGFVANANQQILLRAEGQSATPERLGRVLLKMTEAGPVTLGDVAHIRFGAAPAVGAAAVDGTRGVVVMVEEQYGANTIGVTRRLEQALDGLQPGLTAQGIELHRDLFKPARFIHVALHNLTVALMLGAALVLAVLFLFLFNVRTAIISATAIPLSLLAAVIAMNHLGIGINTMTLGGLAIALGEVVDDAIVDVENVFRRLRENRGRATPRPAAAVVLGASLEVRHVIVYVTFVVALVFVPVITMHGVTGRLFAPLGISYIAAVVASLAVALTVTPALSYLLLRGAGNAEDPAPVKAVKQRYGRMLARLEGHSRPMAIAVVIAVAATAALVPFLKAGFLPHLREGHYIIHMRLMPGSSLAQSIRLGRSVTLAVSKIPGVRSVAQRVGRATLVSDPAGTFASEFEVDLRRLSGARQQQVLQEIRRQLQRFVGADFSVNTFLTERIHETVSGHTAPFVVNIYGPSLGVLDTKARAVAAALRQVPGAQAVRVQAPQGDPELVIRLHRSALTQWGLTPVAVLDTIHIAFAGARAAEVYRNDRFYPVVVRLSRRDRRSPAEVGMLPVRTPSGMVIPLRDVASLRETFGRFTVLHEGGERVQTVTAHFRGRALGSFVRDAKARIGQAVHLQKGYYLLFGGDEVARTRAEHELWLHAGLAAVGVILLLFVALGSLRALSLVLLNVPFALIGGVLAVLFSGATLSIGSLVGFVTLFGITLRNSAMLISHFDHLVTQEGLPWGAETARRGAMERVTPILMTATVTALGLLPLALTSGAPGNEIEGPMAVVILGGLVTSTILNLVVLPVLALRFGRFGTSDARVLA